MKKIFALLPAPQLLWLALAWLALGVAVSFWRQSVSLWWAFGLLLGVAALLDAWAALRLPLPVVTRNVAGSLALGVRHLVRLRLQAPQRGLSLEFFDHHPPHCKADHLPQHLVLKTGRWIEASYGITPQQRGDQHFGQVALRIESPWRLWNRRAQVGEPQMVRVYPNFSAVSKYVLLATDHRLSQIGVLQRRRRGEGMEFESMREYREGDSLRRIDWKAAARLDKLIARDYRDERDQQVVFLLDCSRRMSAKDAELSHFDHALNATLLLAYVALSQGDAVGMATFGSTQERRLAPRKAGGTLNLMLNTLYDLQPSLSVPDYYHAALALLTRVKKRALVVIVSNLRDEDDSTLVPALRLISARHLVLFANLRESVVDDVMQEPVHDLDSALTYSAAVDYALRRRKAFQRISGCGALTIDVTPQRLALALVNRYLGLKSAGQL